MNSREQPTKAMLDENECPEALLSLRTHIASIGTRTVVMQELEDHQNKKLNGNYWGFALLLGCAM
jgi:hypothetical protein